MHTTDRKLSLRTYESETLGLSPIQMVLDEVPSPNPEGWRKGHQSRKPGREMKQVVNRLIEYFKDSDR